MPSRYSLKRLAKLEPEVADRLRQFFRQPYSDAALDATLPDPHWVELKPHPNPTCEGKEDRPSDALRVLALPLVRIQVAMQWQALWQSCPDNKHGLCELSRAASEREIEQSAERTARWICTEHLPYVQDEVVDIARPVWRVLSQLLDSADIEAQLPALQRAQEEPSAAGVAAEPNPAAERPARKLGDRILDDDDLIDEGRGCVESTAAPHQPLSDQGAMGSAESSPRPPFAQKRQSGAGARCDLPLEDLLLRREPIRAAIIDETKRRAENKANRSYDRHRDGMERSALLKRALMPYSDPMLGSNITRRLGWNAREATPQEKAAQRLINKTEELLGAAWVPVEQSGRPFEVSPAAFLKSAHEWALSNRKHPPACEAVGHTHVAKRARDCAAILTFLGDLHRGARAGDGDGFASLNVIARKVRDASGGTIYQRMAKLTSALIEMGFLTASSEDRTEGGGIAIAAEVGDRRVWRALFASASVLKNTK